MRLVAVYAAENSWVEDEKVDLAPDFLGGGLGALNLRTCTMLGMREGGKAYS